MDNLADPIRRVVADMRLIQESLTKVIAAPPTHSGCTQTLDLDHVNELKSAVDNMRTILWAYFESVSRTGGRDLGDTLQTLRMQRTTEMLRAMDEDMANKPLPDAEAWSFFEALQRVASVVVDRHMPQTRLGQQQQATDSAGLLPEK